MNTIERISQELHLKPWQIKAAVALMDAGNTVPFIARYRKEAHGNMNDEQLRTLEARLKTLRLLEQRKRSVLAAVEEQGKLTAELRRAIDAAQTSAEVENLYRPYRRKRRTRAMIAREKGMMPLAEYLLSADADRPVLQEAERYVDEEHGVPDAATAVQLAEDILAEQLSDWADVRAWVFREMARKGRLRAQKKKHNGDAGEKGCEGKRAQREGKYTQYGDMEEAGSHIPGHRILAINRGEKEQFLSVRIEVPDEEIISYLYRTLAGSSGGKTVKPGSVNPVTCACLKKAAADAWKRFIRPSVETELRRTLTERAETGAIKVFSSNLRQLLMQPPVAGEVVLGWDPAFRTGCKLAVVDATGKVLDTAVIYPLAPQHHVSEASQTLRTLYDRYQYHLISCGNGTASRESEQIIAAFIRESGLPIRYVITNEAGASVYSAGKLAAEELPQFDVGQRSAVSIARRVQDPLAELVKIDPKSIGVGQYQHDMNQTRLSEALNGVVEDCVNQVGVDANTASAALLCHVAGISTAVAKNIVSFREQNGRFQTRRDFLKVKGLGPKTFKQCAGFMRIADGKEVLDRTAVHPESYDVAKKLLSRFGCTKQDVIGGNTKTLQQHITERMGIGEYSLRDIIEELQKPGRDPRDQIPDPVLRRDIRSMEDLKTGMKLVGTVRNIVDFGAFVDIGVHQDGLVHISQMTDRFVQHPLDVVKVGEVVNVKVLKIDLKQHRISLTMKDV